MLRHAPVPAVNNRRLVDNRLAGAIFRHRFEAPQNVLDWAQESHLSVRIREGKAAPLFTYRQLLIA